MTVTEAISAAAIAAAFPIAGIILGVLITNYVTLKREKTSFQQKHVNDTKLANIKYE